MELKTLNTYSVTKYGGLTFDCKCGRMHTLETNAVFFESNAMDKLCVALETCASPLSLAFVITEKSIADMCDTRIDKIITRGGFRCAMHVFDKSPTASVSTADRIVVTEDARVIVGIGGGVIADIAKYKAKQAGLPCVLVITSPTAIGAFLPSAMLENKKIEQTYKTDAPVAVVCDTELFRLCPKKLTAAAFGGLVSKLVALFDWRTASLINSEYFCPELFEAALSVIDGCIDKVCASTYQSVSLSPAVAEDNLRFSAVCALTGSSRLTSGAETQCAYALKLLLENEERECFLRGENEFLFSRIIMKTYKNLLGSPGSFFVPPPDNNLRLELIAQYFGIEEKYAVEKIRPIVEARAQKLCAYKVGEYRDELYSLACEFDMRLSRAWRPFKRIYDDDGFALEGYLDPLDVSVCLALAPDLKEKFTMLTYMKNAGLLETYLA